MNNKGFTLVELLAMLAVLAILMVITIPNITGILSENKNKMVIEDVKKMVNMTKSEIVTNPKVKYPSKDKCIMFTLQNIDLNEDLKSGAQGGVYERRESIVVVKRVGNTYKYYVKLVEKVKEGDGFYYYGVKYADYDAFLKDYKDQIQTFFTPEEILMFNTIGSDTDIDNYLKNEENYDDIVTEILNKKFSLICDKGLEKVYT